MKREYCGALLASCLLAACAPEPEVASGEVARLEAVFELAAVTPAVQEKWLRSCALCHVHGQGGAPRMGDLAAWQPRVENGRAAMLENTLKGLNRMPPLGYCMDCEMTDFAAMITMMSGYNQ